MRKIENQNIDKVGGGWEFEVDEADGAGLFWLKAAEINHLLENGYKLRFIDVEESQCLCEVGVVNDGGVYVEVTDDKMAEIFP